MNDFNTSPDFSTSLGNLGEVRDADPNPIAATTLWSSQGMLYLLLLIQTDEWSFMGQLE